MMQTEHLNMLNDIHELSQIFVKSTNLSSFLRSAAEAIARHLDAERCSIYIYDQTKDKLNMKASTRKKIERVKLSCRAGEGIVGKALADSKPVFATSSTVNENSDLKSSNEDIGSMVAVPVIQGFNRIGVILAFRTTSFSKSDAISLKIMASQLSTIIEEVRVLMILKMNHTEHLPKFSKNVSTFISGKPASGGYAHGISLQMTKARNFKAYLYKKFKKSYTIDEFNKAISTTVSELGILQEKVGEKLSDVASLIFSAHLLILKDKGFTKKILHMISDGTNPPDAIIKVAKEYIDIFSMSPNPIIREKVYDIEDLAVRLLNNMTKKSKSTQDFRNRIVIAEEIYPSDILHLSAMKARGLILLRGGITSHVAILSSSLNLPMIIASDLRLLSLTDDTELLLDAETGNIHIHPSSEMIKENKLREQNLQRFLENKELILKNSETTDGIKVSLFSNVNLLSEISLASKYNSSGIGLYRTEFPFLLRANFPTEEEQLIVYSKIIEEMAGKPATFRTLDIGGDKFLHYHELKEKNPFLGFRSIRFSLENPEIFKQQIRAILRAGINSNLSIMFPMIASVEELIRAKELVNECMDELDQMKIDYHKNPKLGIMVEVPSIIDVLDELTKEVDFLSIGTNDLMQFLMAADRTNEKVQNIYNPLHPSVIRTLKRVHDIAKKNNTSVSICGDVAQNIQFIAILIGIGFRNFSVNPAYIPQVKYVVIHLSSEECRKMVNQVLTKVYIREIDTILSNFNKKWLPPGILDKTFI